LLPTVTDTEDSDDESKEDEDLSKDISMRRHPDIPDSVFTPLERTGKSTSLLTEDVDVQGLTPQPELLAWHYRLGHLSFKLIKAINVYPFTKWN